MIQLFLHKVPKAIGAISHYTPYPLLQWRGIRGSICSTLALLLAMSGCVKQGDSSFLSAEVQELKVKVSTLEHLVASQQSSVRILELNWRNCAELIREVSKEARAYRSSDQPDGHQEIIRRLSAIEDRLCALDGEAASNDAFGIILGGGKGRVKKLEDRVRWLEIEIE